MVMGVFFCRRRFQFYFDSNCNQWVSPTHHKTTGKLLVRRFFNHWHPMSKDSVGQRECFFNCLSGSVRQRTISKIERGWSNALYFTIYSCQLSERNCSWHHRVTAYVSPFFVFDWPFRMSTITVTYKVKWHRRFLRHDPSQVPNHPINPHELDQVRETWRNHDLIWGTHQIS